MAKSLNLFEPSGSPPAGERVANPSAARRGEARPPEGRRPASERADAGSPAKIPPISEPPTTPSRDAPLDRFAVLLGRAPTDAEKLELVRVKEALDLDNNDALWLLIMGLHHLRGRFEASIDGQRRQFEASIDRRLAAVEAATGHVVESAKAQFLRDFPAALKQAARKGAVRAIGYGGPGVLTGLIAGLALLMVGIGSVGWLAYDLGKSAGYEQGVLAQQAATPPAPKPSAPPARGR